MSQPVDLRGVVCPLNFVKATLALEPLGPGEEIGILLDDGEPVANVPRSLADAGHQVLSLTRDQTAGAWLLRVRKAST